jgi:hypothetical protein
MTARGTSPVADLGVLVNYVRRLRKLRPAAFLGFTAKPNIYGSIAASLCGVPVINNISGLGTVFARRTLVTRIVVRLYTLALRRSGTVFFQNYEDQALFEQLHVIDPSRALLLPGSGVDLAHFAPRGKKTDPRFTFLFAARLLWDKGIGEFVEAARRIRRAIATFASASSGGSSRSRAPRLIWTASRMGGGGRDRICRLSRGCPAGLCRVRLRRAPNLLSRGRSTGSPRGRGNGPFRRSPAMRRAAGTRSITAPPDCFASLARSIP